MQSRLVYHALSKENRLICYVLKMNIFVLKNKVSTDYKSNLSQKNFNGLGNKSLLF